MPGADEADAYLARLSSEKRATLQKVRQAIRAAAPAAEEGMSYGMPAFIQGKPIAGYAAGATHCAYYPMSGAIVSALEERLAGYETSKGAIRFPVGKPLPATLVRELVKARLTEIAALAHPLRKEIDVARRAILGVSPTIREGIKWNAPSFRTESEYFATVNLRSRGDLQLVFHLGAKTRANPKAFPIPDPKGLVTWLAKDRALVTLGHGRMVAANRAAFAAIVRAWIAHV